VRGIVRPVQAVDAAIFAAGFGAGAINAVAGGGTLLSYPLLLWIGRDAVVANATNALALWPGALAGAYGFRRELGDARRLLPWLLPPAALGAVFGGWLLLQTPSRLFVSIVPWLVLAATLLIAAQRPLMRLLGLASNEESRLDSGGRKRRAVLVTAQLVVSIYGGYFGAAMGILMLAALGLYGLGDVHQRNGLKGLLGAVINGVAGLYFAVSGAIDWGDAAILSVGAVLGGYAGASTSRRLDRRTVELIVIAIGFGAAVSLLLRAPGPV